MMVQLHIAHCAIELVLHATEDLIIIVRLVKVIVLFRGTNAFAIPVLLFI